MGKSETSTTPRSIGVSSPEISTNPAMTTSFNPLVTVTKSASLTKTINRHSDEEISYGTEFTKVSDIVSEEPSTSKAPPFLRTSVSTTKPRTESMREVRSTTVKHMDRTAKHSTRPSTATPQSSSRTKIGSMEISSHAIKTTTVTPRETVRKVATKEFASTKISVTTHAAHMKLEGIHLINSTHKSTGSTITKRNVMHDSTSTQRTVTDSVSRITKSNNKKTSPTKQEEKFSTATPALNQNASSSSTSSLPSTLKESLRHQEREREGGLQRHEESTTKSSGSRVVSQTVHSKENVTERTVYDKSDMKHVASTSHAKNDTSLPKEGNDSHTQSKVLTSKQTSSFKTTRMTLTPKATQRRDVTTKHENDDTRDEHHHDKDIVSKSKEDKRRVDSFSAVGQLKTKKADLEAQRKCTLLSSRRHESMADKKTTAMMTSTRHTSSEEPTRTTSPLTSDKTSSGHFPSDKRDVTIAKQTTKRSTDGKGNDKEISPSTRATTVSSASSVRIFEKGFRTTNHLTTWTVTLKPLLEERITASRQLLTSKVASSSKEAKSSTQPVHSTMFQTTTEKQLESKTTIHSRHTSSIRKHSTAYNNFVGNTVNYSRTQKVDMSTTRAMKRLTAHDMTTRAISSLSKPPTSPTIQTTSHTQIPSPTTQGQSKWTANQSRTIYHFRTQPTTISAFQTTFTPKITTPSTGTSLAFKATAQSEVVVDVSGKEAVLQTFLSMKLGDFISLMSKVKQRNSNVEKIATIFPLIPEKNETTTATNRKRETTTPETGDQKMKRTVLNKFEYSNRDIKVDVTISKAGELFSWKYNKNETDQLPEHLRLMLRNAGHDDEVTTKVVTFKSPNLWSLWFDWAHNASVKQNYGHWLQSLDNSLHRQLSLFETTTTTLQTSKTQANQETTTDSPVTVSAIDQTVKPYVAVSSTTTAPRKVSELYSLSTRLSSKEVKVRKETRMTSEGSRVNPVKEMTTEKIEKHDTKQTTREMHASSSVTSSPSSSLESRTPLRKEKAIGKTTLQVRDDDGKIMLKSQETKLSHQTTSLSHQTFPVKENNSPATHDKFDKRTTRQLALLVVVEKEKETSSVATVLKNCKTTRRITTQSLPSLRHQTTTANATTTSSHSKITNLISEHPHNVKSSTSSSGIKAKESQATTIAISRSTTPMGHSIVSSTMREHYKRSSATSSETLARILIETGTSSVDLGLTVSGSKTTHTLPSTHTARHVSIMTPLSADKITDSRFEATRTVATKLPETTSTKSSVETTEIKVPKWKKLLKRHVRRKLRIKKHKHPTPMTIVSQTIVSQSDNASVQANRRRKREAERLEEVTETHILRNSPQTTTMITVTPHDSDLDPYSYCDVSQMNSKYEAAKCQKSCYMKCSVEDSPVDQCEDACLLLRCFKKKSVDEEKGEDQCETSCSEACKGEKRLRQHQEGIRQLSGRECTRLLSKYLFLWDQQYHEQVLQEGHCDSSDDNSLNNNQ